jgi:hypothetical protein
VCVRARVRMRVLAHMHIIQMLNLQTDFHNCGYSIMSLDAA